MRKSNKRGNHVLVSWTAPKEIYLLLFCFLIYTHLYKNTEEVHYQFVVHLNNLWTSENASYYKWGIFFLEFGPWSNSFKLTSWIFFITQTIQQLIEVSKTPIFEQLGRMNSTRIKEHKRWPKVHEEVRFTPSFEENIKLNHCTKLSYTDHSIRIRIWIS